jgi:hypothetical protein
MQFLMLEDVFCCTDECIVTGEAADRSLGQGSAPAWLVDKLDDWRLPPTEFRA